MRENFILLREVQSFYGAHKNRKKGPEEREVAREIDDLIRPAAKLPPPPPPFLQLLQYTARACACERL